MSGNDIPQQTAAPQGVQQTTAEIEVIQVNLDDEKMNAPDKEEEKCDKKGKKSSKAWLYFEELKGCPIGFEKAKCKFCNMVIGCNTNKNGTSTMMNHLKTVCAKSPMCNNLDKLQKTLKFEKLSWDENSQTLKAHTFDQEKLRKKLALMCINDNQPFRIMEHEGFRELINEAEPKFKIPSRWTVARDCLKIYDEELLKLKRSLVSERVSFTTDTWTSV
ncbi:hypothetical protein AgCh_029281 [Apium graveolens]